MHSIVGINRIDKIRQKIMKRIGDAKKSLKRWYGHVECIVNNKLVKKIYSNTVEGTMSRGMIGDRMQCKKFLYGGGVNRDNGLT